MSTTYNTQASNFLDSAKIRIIKTHTWTRLYFPTDTQVRDCYSIRVERIDAPQKYFTFDFGDSIYNTELRSWINPDREKRDKIKDWPTTYSILSTLSAESNQYNTLQDFCDNMGYDTDSRKALDTYLACQEMATKINNFFTPSELDTLREIQ